MEAIKQVIAKINQTIDAYLPNVPNWVVWGILVYLIIK